MVVKNNLNSIHCLIKCITYDNFTFRKNKNSNNNIITSIIIIFNNTLKNVLKCI